MDRDLRPLIQKVAITRAALLTAEFMDDNNEDLVRSQVSELRTAELALALARQSAFLKIQVSSTRFLPNQVAAYASMGATTANAQGGYYGRTRISDLYPEQTASLNQMAAEQQPAVQRVNEARLAMSTDSLSTKSAAAIQSDADALAKAELALAQLRADGFTRLQASSARLAGGQVASLIAMGGSVPYYRGMVANAGPSPLQGLDFNDHTNYISLFDGKTLDRWEGNPKFWRAENGEIVGESTVDNPSGNQYIVYRATKAHDFTLKFEIKVDNAGGTGFQYRSQTGIPWVSAIPLDVTANIGQVDNNLMMTGPQADFWPSGDPFSRNSGQFYSENNPMRIMASRGNVVEGAGLGPKRLMGLIGDPTALFAAVKPTGWNEYTVIARGGTFIHIINGQLMAVMVDDDPNSINNQTGLFGIEIEATARIHVRNIWLKKLN